jgi:hypothetical protein
MKIRSKQFISSQTFPRTSGERVQKTTVEERFESQILDSFDPVTQKLYQILPAKKKRLFLLCPRWNVLVAHSTEMSGSGNGGRRNTAAEKLTGALEHQIDRNSLGLATDSVTDSRSKPRAEDQMTS